MIRSSKATIIASASGTLSRLSMPGAFRLSGGRGLLINMLDLPLHFRLLALLPALFLATLFFLDQNISVRTVNSPSHKLQSSFEAASARTSRS